MAASTVKEAPSGRNWQRKEKIMAKGIMMVWERNVAASRETRQQVREIVSRVEKQGSGDTEAG